MLLQAVLAVLSGGLVGFTLGLIGGGGSILATPLLLYVVGLQPHVAIGTGALAVSANAFANFAGHARVGNVKWLDAAIFAAVGMAGAAIGSWFGKSFDGQRLLFLFAILMVVVGVLMLRRKEAKVSTAADEGRRSNGRLVLIAACALGVGLLSGFFGIGGGFLIVPGLLFSTGMPMIFAVGSSLLAVGAFGLTTAVSYASSGLIDWVVALEYIVGGLAGGYVGMQLACHLGHRKAALNRIFAGLVFVVAFYMLYRNAAAFGFGGLTLPPDHGNPGTRYMLNKCLSVLVLCLTIGGTASAETLRVYGPGGPLPAMREAAEAYGRTPRRGSPDHRRSDRKLDRARQG